MNLKLSVAHVQNALLIFIGVAVSALLPFSSFAALEAVTWTSEDSLPALRWIYAAGEAPKAKAGDPVYLLVQVKRTQSSGDFAKCVSLARSARAKAKSLQGWLAIIEIDCATNLLIGTKSPAATGDGTAKVLATALEAASKNQSWLAFGPQASPLRVVTIRGYLELLDQDIKTNRTRAWTAVERLEELQNFMDDRAKGKLWRGAGELAFAQQKLDASRDFLRRSLNEFESEETRSRLSVIESAIASLGGPRSAVATIALKAGTSTLDFSKEEQDLVDRITGSLKSGDLVLAVEDSVKILMTFPGSTRAKWASDRALEAYTSLLERNDSSYQSLRDQMIQQMSKVDSDRTAEWARVLYNRAQFADSLALARASVEKTDGARRTKILEIAGEAAIANEKFELAIDYFRELADQHAGTPAAREAMMRMGLANYRLSRYTQAIADFEKLLAIGQNESFEVVSRYWLWRALMKTKSDRADAAADELMRKFPFSYYGLRARLERERRSGESSAALGVLEWRPESKKLETKVWLTGKQRVAWEKAHLLLKAGWLEEAQSELKELPPPIRAEDKAIRSLIWSAAAGFVTASKLANEAWDEKPELRRPPFINAAFPNEFGSFISNQASARKVDRSLVQGLIKQESGFDVRAVSTSNAMGLMQMIPPTAREIATDLKLGNIEIPNDMFEPSRNIQMGTYYLSRMLSKHKGHVPLALASYNAGPARMDRWLRTRPSLANLATSRSSAFDDELWFDEIPYSETSFYVKAILRNLLLYKLLDQGRVEVPNPVWSSTASP